MIAVEHEANGVQILARLGIHFLIVVADKTAVVEARPVMIIASEGLRRGREECAK